MTFCDRKQAFWLFFFCFFLLVGARSNFLAFHFSVTLNVWRKELETNWDCHFSSWHNLLLVLLLVLPRAGDSHWLSCLWRRSWLSSVLWWERWVTQQKVGRLWRWVGMFQVMIECVRPNRGQKTWSFMFVLRFFYHFIFFKNVISMYFVVCLKGFSHIVIHAQSEEMVVVGGGLTLGT